MGYKGILSNYRVVRDFDNENYSTSKESLDRCRCWEQPLFKKEKNRRNSGTINWTLNTGKLCEMSCDPLRRFFDREDSTVEPACGRSVLVCFVRLIDYSRAISLARVIVGSCSEFARWAIFKIPKSERTYRYRLSKHGEPTARHRMRLPRPNEMAPREEIPSGNAVEQEACRAACYGGDYPMLLRPSFKTLLYAVQRSTSDFKPHRVEVETVYYRDCAETENLKS